MLAKGLLLGKTVWCLMLLVRSFSPLTIFVALYTLFALEWPLLTPHRMTTNEGWKDEHRDDLRSHSNLVFSPGCVRLV